MISAIAHRGPDGQGMRIVDHAALGHARLAIIDIAGGAQPMATAGGDLIVTFNGEIYNYRELRQELSAHGYAFRTDSDTEVILALYAIQGVQGFARLRGMYAIALWDSRRRAGVLARDPLGIKPLFISQRADGTLHFASEAKAILAGEGRRGELDESALHLLMNFRYLPGEGSLFRGIRQIAPGEVVTWQPGHSISTETIAPLLPPNDDRSVLEVFQQSVATHLTADVEVGAYLSGGIDSAAIAASAVGHGYTDLRTFTMDVGDDPREAQHAARTAEILGVRNLPSRCPEDAAGALPKLIWHLELPKINAFQVSELARHTAQHVKVALSGLGGDELFLGYNMHEILAQARLLSRCVPGALSHTVGALGADALRGLSPVPWSEAERAFRMLMSINCWPRVYGVLRNVWDAPDLRERLYGPRLLDADLPDAFDILENHWPNTKDPVLAAAEFEWRHKMVNDLLWQEDRCSMAASLEARVPFLDVQLAAAVHRLGRKELMPGMKPKAYMRTMLRQILPAEILRRPKSGFQVDAPQFYHRQLKTMAREYLSDKKVRSYGLFNPQFVQSITQNRPRPGLRWHYFILYLMLATHIWIDLFETNPLVSPESDEIGDDESLGDLPAVQAV
jgi:asparagine synthase (glutamine-hydrolysing)